jgi:hypothetical protein
MYVILPLESFDFRRVYHIQKIVRKENVSEVGLFLWKWDFKGKDFSTNSSIILILAELLLKWHDYQETCTIIDNPALLSLKASAILDRQSSFIDKSHAKSSLSSVLQI